MAAPKPRPAALKLLNGRGPGVDSGGRKVKPPPPFVRTAPEPPADLDAVALEEWNRVVPEMERLKMLKGASRASLVAYCQTWSRYVTAANELARHIETTGAITYDAKQGLIPHPCVTICRGEQAELRRWAGEFGFTPSAEGKLSVPEADDGEDFDAFT